MDRSEPKLLYSRRFCFFIALPFPVFSHASRCCWCARITSLGMMPLVGLPLAFALVIHSLGHSRPRVYRFSLAVGLFIYLLGLAGFLYGLSSPQLYGLHIQLAELVYKTLAPMLLILLASWVLYQEKNQSLNRPGSRYFPSLHE